MKFKSTIATFIALVAGTCLLTFLNPSSEKIETKQEVTPIVQTETNSTVNATNETDRALNNKPAQNMDWFIQGSNYIWDGWKIK